MGCLYIKIWSPSSWVTIHIPGIQKVLSLTINVSPKNIDFFLPFHTNDTMITSLVTSQIHHHFNIELICLLLF